MTLKVAFATKKATQYACKHWHYAHKIPAGKLFPVGIWKDGHFLGVIIFSHGANKFIGKPYNLNQYQVLELTRVALRNHKGVFVSELLSKALAFLKEKQPKLVMLVSYADPMQGHKGGIYQATNWIYIGDTPANRKYIQNGKTIHPHSAGDFLREHKNLWDNFNGSQLEFLQKYRDKNIKMIKTLGKHKYLMPLNKKARRRLKKLALPYPKSATDGQKMKNIKVDLSDCITSKL